MKRRTFLQGSVASFSALAFPFSGAASASASGLAMVVIDNIDTYLSPTSYCSTGRFECSLDSSYLLCFALS